MTTRGVTTIKEVRADALWSGGRYVVRLHLGTRDLDLTVAQADRLAGQLTAAVQVVRAHEGKTPRSAPISALAKALVKPGELLT